MNDQSRGSILELRRLLLIVLAVSVTAFTGGVFVLVQRIFDNFGPGVEKDLAWKTVRGAQELAKAVDLGLVVKDAAMVKRGFDDYARSEDVVAIVAEDADHQVIAAHRTVPGTMPPFAGAPLELHESDLYLRSWAPAVIEGGAVGRVALVVSKRRLVESQRLLGRVSLATAVAGGLGLVGGVAFILFFTRGIAQRDDQLARHAAELEQKVRERTAELDRMNRGMRLVFETVEQGFITISPEGAMSAERSAIVDRWLGELPAGATLVDAIRPHDGTAADWLEVGLQALRDQILPLELLLQQLPRRMCLRDRTLRLDYKPISREGVVVQLLVVLTDVTDEIVRERVERDSREMGQVFRRIGSDRPGFEEFFREATALVAQIVSGANGHQVERRLVHTLKGNASLYGLESIADLCHQLETTWQAEDRGSSEAERERLHHEWTRIGELVRSMLGADRGTLAVDESDLRGLLDAIRNGASATDLAATVNSWWDEPVALRFSRMAEKARYLCRRLGKPEVLVHTEASGLRLDAIRWNGFWSALVHAVANAVDHGIEDPATRQAQDKPERGQLWLTAQRDSRSLVIGVRDDGAGIDWTRLAGSAAARGLAHGTREELTAALFVDGVSTRDAANLTSGRGVGLSALQQATEKLGGKIDVGSEPGKGTRLTFRFPVNSATASPGRFGSPHERVA